MSTERLKRMLIEAREEVAKLPWWMKMQEPIPGESWADFIKRNSPK